MTVKASDNSITGWLKALELVKTLAIKDKEAAKVVRSQFKKALKSVESDGRHRIAADWLSWEKLFGSA